MKTQYLLSLKARYQNDAEFQEWVNRAALILNNLNVSNDDLVRVADMAAIVAMDFKEHQRKKNLN